MAQAPDGRTPGQVADEQAMAHVSAVLTNLDWTIERAKKGLKDLRKAGTDEGRNAELALTDLLGRAGAGPQALFQDSYFPADTTRLL